MLMIQSKIFSFLHANNAESTVMELPNSIQFKTSFAAFIRISSSEQLIV